MVCTRSNERLGGCAAPERHCEDGGRHRSPRLLLSGEAVLAESVADHFRGLGWAVHAAEAGDDLPALARALDPHGIVLAADEAGESGFLACAKLVGERPAVRVVLVGEEPSAHAERFAAFVGAAAYVAAGDGPGRAIAAIVGAMAC